jgi:hypothetical protein
MFPGTHFSTAFFYGFRHIFRHCYSYELDWEKEKLVADKFDKAVELFKNEIDSYIIFLKSIYSSS